MLEYCSKLQFYVEDAVELNDIRQQNSRVQKCVHSVVVDIELTSLYFVFVMSLRYE